jgi:hypothetical protein
LEAWLEQQDIGFKVAFLPEEQAFEFFLYDGRLAAAEFCENFRNITDQQYFHQTAQARNVVIVEGQPLTDETTEEPCLPGFLYRVLIKKSLKYKEKIKNIT